MHKQLAALIVFAVTASAPALADALRDPTRPTRALPEARQSAPLSRLKVSAVFISGERRIAVVNGRRVHEGDRIGGATVTAIEAGNVHFLRQGKPFAVPLLNGTTRN